MTKPNKIDLTFEQVKELKSSINGSNLNESDKTLVQGLIDFNGWLQQQLLEKRISIGRLKSMIFGNPMPTNKNRLSKKSDKGSGDDGTFIDAPAKNDSDSNEQKSHDDKSGNNKNGRLSHHHYLQAEKTEAKHHLYSAGDLCPTDCGGKLWNVLPGNVIKINGQGFAKATLYELEKLRCSLCGYYTTANLPKYVSKDKYDYAFKAQQCSNQNA